MSKMRDNDEYGQRMKAYEAVETARRLDPALPVYARIDGRGFSRFTQGMEKPFDARMTEAMIETARHLVDQTKARIGYVQSDEISLVWQAETANPDIFFSGKLQKLVSVLASVAAAKFASVCPKGYEHRLPAFDCRVFQLPDRIEAANTFLWRAMDCRRNAVSMVAQKHFPPSALDGRRQEDMHAMLREIGVDFMTYPEANRLGVFLGRRPAERSLTAEEIGRIPPERRPQGPVLRSSIVAIPMPPFHQVANRVEVLFEGAEPIHRDSPEGRAYVEAQQAQLAANSAETAGWAV
jgi:tRNA(His) 5'-end guanylyltransferase